MLLQCRRQALIYLLIFQGWKFPKMSVKSLASSGIKNFAVYRSGLAGNIPNLPRIQYLVIAGGGSGAAAAASNAGSGGGGGAGGYRCSVPGESSGGLSSSEAQLIINDQILLGTSYPVTVGAGGANLPPGNTIGNNGINSTFGPITSIGGGGGGNKNVAGRSGGSGGGGGGASAQGGTNTATQGSNGGSGGTSSSPNASNAGGGGGAGQPGNTTTSGKGGDGLISSISGTPVTRAGGGGSGSFGGFSRLGGAGGGGVGGFQAGESGSTAGAVNTGSGGGGGGDNTGAGTNGGAGGSGVVILKYPDTHIITVGAGLTGTTPPASGGFKVTTITAGTGNVSFALA